MCERHKNSRQTRFYLTPTVFLCRSRTPTWVCQHEFANLSLPCEGRLRQDTLFLMMECTLQGREGGEGPCILLGNGNFPQTHCEESWAPGIMNGKAHYALFILISGHSDGRRIAQREQSEKFIFLRHRVCQKCTLWSFYA